MKIFCIMLVSCMWGYVYAQNSNLATPIIEVWSLGSMLYPMEKDPLTNALISKSCLEKKNQCAAFRALKNLKKFKLTEKDLLGGKNPGAVICKKFIAGDVLILRDEKQDETSFCKFEDGSLLSTGALR